MKGYVGRVAWRTNVGRAFNGWKNGDLLGFMVIHWDLFGFIVTYWDLWIFIGFFGDLNVELWQTL